MKPGRKSRSSCTQLTDERERDGGNARGDYDKFKREDEESQRGGNKIMEEWSQRDEEGGGWGGVQGKKVAALP